MKLKYAGFCEQGMRDGVNQDRIGMFQEGKKGLFFVSDGMGGHYAGEKASSTIETALSAWWQTYCAAEKSDFAETVSQIKSVLADAHRQIQEDTKGHGISGATIVLLLIAERQYALLWAGDSRCYLMEQQFLGGHSKLLTVDDTWENHLAIGYTESEKRTHPLYGKLLSAVGVGNEFSCHLQIGEMKKNTLFILCSDGVYKYLEYAKMTIEMKAALKKEDLVNSLAHLRDMVYENHAPDNLSCVMVAAFE